MSNTQLDHSIEPCDCASLERALASEIAEAHRAVGHARQCHDGLATQVAVERLAALLEVVAVARALEQRDEEARALASEIVSDPLPLVVA